MIKINEDLKMTFVPHIVEQRPDGTQRRSYTCRILDVKSDAYIAEGTATNHSTDKFVKEIGRRESLKKALANGTFDKNQRQEIWNAYFRR